ncbi:hypothetical protein ACJ41O_011098 [Fusarium nematophilum]
MPQWTKQHKKLGSHERISPNHVSILDPWTTYEIYGHGANMLKEGWYGAGAAKTVIGLEPILKDTVGALMAEIGRHIAAGTRPNMRRLVNYFTIDLFGQILFGHQLGCLDRGDDLLVADAKDGRLYKAPFIDSLLDVAVVNTALGMMPNLLPFSRPLFQNHPYKKAGVDWENILHHNIKERRESGVPSDDLFQKLLQDSEGQDLNLHPGVIAAECATLMNAGTDTTAAALTSTIYLLYTYPEVLQKLREEVDNAVPGSGIPSYETASKLPYLRACIEESLRVRPASSMGPSSNSARRGQIPTYSLLRNDKVFKNAPQYDPDRWMTEDQEEKKAMMMNSNLPFSTGPRACISRNIAYFEQIVIIAAIVKFFDGHVEEGFRLVTEERFNSNQGPLPMEMARRRL